MVSEKSPLTNCVTFQLKPFFIFLSVLLNEAMSEPLLIQLTSMRDSSVAGGNVTLQGRVAFAFGLACISLGDTVTEKVQIKRK